MTSEYRGKVVRRLFGRGSKSEHDALFLETDAGAFRLRRVDGNPFQDSALDALVGHRIAGKGSLRENTLVLESWTILE